ncbi:metal ABC transporter substrate-binding protein [Salicola sp. Rm-C-2C1-2]|uniref:zinc ABC transporter substrate-binding protein n=1 Tax=Salicola sp. Rm-C-2C1-2 TaxID=3141321 RepID=UPI0032E4D026
MMKRCLHHVLILLLSLASTPAWAQRPLIATSIHPLALIVKEVAGDEADVQSLVPADVSPHHYSMRPSERRLLAEADRIYWLSPELEPFLQGIMSDQALSQKALALAEAPESSTAGNGHEAHHHGTGMDPHIWLAPDRAQAMAKRVRESLAGVKDLDQEQIARNHNQFRQRLADTESDIEKRLAPLARISLFTYHDAFHYFADHFGLTIAATLTNNPERSPSARHIADLQQALEEARFPCIMTESQLGGNWWRGLDLPQSLNVSRWDPLGGEIRIKVGGYTAFLESLTDAVSRCQPDNSKKE